MIKFAIKVYWLHDLEHIKYENIVSKLDKKPQTDFSHDMLILQAAFRTYPWVRPLLHAIYATTHPWACFSVSNYSSSLLMGLPFTWWNHLRQNSAIFSKVGATLTYSQIHSFLILALYAYSLPIQCNILISSILRLCSCWQMSLIVVR